MRIDMKRQAEVNQRKGLTRRAVMSFLWLLLCLILAFLATGWLVDSGTMSRGFVYGTLGLPPTIDMQVVRVAAMLILVIALQLIAVIFFALTSPAAKKRSGRPTATAESLDYYEQQSNRPA